MEELLKKFDEMWADQNKGILDLATKEALKQRDRAWFKMGLRTAFRMSGKKYMELLNEFSEISEHSLW